MRAFLTTFTTLLIVGVLLGLIFWPDFAEQLWILAHYLKYLWMLGLGIWLTILVVAALSPREHRGTAAKCTLALVLTTVFAFTSGPRAGEMVRFALLRGSYEAQLATILKAEAESRPIDEKGLPDLAHIDAGLPHRVAFYWQRGVTDNWVGVVYDPTGEVMKATDFEPDWSNWSDPKLQGVKLLFGGDLFRARRLTGHWYLCWFT